MDRRGLFFASQTQLSTRMGNSFLSLLDEAIPLIAVRTAPQPFWRLIAAALTGVNDFGFGHDYLDEFRALRHISVSFQRNDLRLAGVRRLLRIGSAQEPGSNVPVLPCVRDHRDRLAIVTGDDPEQCRMSIGMKRYAL